MRKYRRRLHQEIPEVEEIPIKEPIETKPEDKIEVSPKIESPSIVPKSEVPINLKKAFDRVKSFLLKSYEKNQRPIVNVKAVKNILSDNYSEEKAYKLAGSVKSFIESQVEPDNVDEIFERALNQLQQEIKSSE